MIIIMVSMGVNILRHCPIGQSTGMPFVFIKGHCQVTVTSVIVWTCIVYVSYTYCITSWSLSPPLVNSNYFALGARHVSTPHGLDRAAMLFYSCAE